MKATSGTQVINDLNEFINILNEILRGINDDKVVIEAERTSNLVVISHRLKKKFILSNWSCLGSFNSCSRRLFNSLESSLGRKTLDRIFSSFDGWIRGKYPVKANVRGLVVYPFSVKIIIENETVEYRALIGRDLFKTKTVLRKEIE